MPVSLGREGTAPAGISCVDNDDIRNVTITDECEQIDTTARGSKVGQKWWKNYAVGFKTTTIEIECLNHSADVGAKYGNYECVSIATNEPLDDVVSYTLTFKPAST